MSAKRTLNLAKKDRGRLSPVGFAASLAAVLLIAVLFSELAVSRRLERVRAAEAELSRLEAETVELERVASEYPELSQEYLRWCFSGGGLPDRDSVLELVEEGVFPVCGVKSLTVSGRTLSLELVGLTLGEVSELILSLEEYDIVESAELSSVGGQGSSAKLTVTLREPDGEQAGGD